MKSFVEILTDIHEHNAHKKKNLFHHCAADDIAFMESLAPPINDIQRSYNQHLCQRYINDSIIQDLVYNTVAGVMFFPVLLLLGIKSVVVKKEDSVDAVFFKDYYSMKIMPASLSNQIKTYKIASYNKVSLSFSDMLYVVDIWKKHPVSFFFCFKCMIRIAAYSHAIEIYHPNMICVSSEYSCTSSVLTHYCEEKKIKHVNIMHGDKLLNIRESFFRFTMFYVWDEHYVQLFRKLNSCETEFVVERPNLLPIIRNNPIHYTYYLQIHSRDELERIKEALDSLDHDYVVRPHPSHFTNDIVDVFGKDKIENPNIVNIDESLASSLAAISGYSTVLLQAYWHGIQVIIDDYSEYKRYVSLKERYYIMINKEHKLLSEIIK